MAAGRSGDPNDVVVDIKDKIVLAHQGAPNDKFRAIIDVKRDTIARLFLSI